MKKLLFAAVPLLVMSTAAFSAVTTCTGNYTLTGAGVLTQGTVVAGNSCEIGDKIFSNFSGSLSNASDTISFTGSGLNYGLNVNAGTESFLTSNFTFGYILTVDQTAAALITPGTTTAITRVTAGVQDNGGATGDVANLVKTVTVLTGAGACPGGATATGNANFAFPVNCNLTGATSIQVSESYTYGAVQANPASITGIGNSFTQTATSTSATPEPVSLLLFGSGLLACSFIGRKRLARK